ncbi:MAG TPA: ABC transporter permease, partial [Nocardioides sp.]|nr:ABC transporter permease [Nocardioides sp.]
ILGPTGVYAGIAIANTLLMGSLQRRREFAATRLVGASEAQVRRMVVAETGLVTAVALLLGATVTVGVAVLLRTPMTAGLDDVPLTVPWPSLLAIVMACGVVAVGAAVLPVRAMLRRIGPADAVG